MDLFDQKSEIFLTTTDYNPSSQNH